MDLSSNNTLLLRLLVRIDPAIFYWLLLFAKAIFYIIDVMLDLMFHHTITGGSRNDRQKALKDYEHSAQLVRVMGRGAYSIVSTHSLNNFLYRHVTYLHPNFILENDHVTIFAVTPTHVLFAVTDPAAKDSVYDTAFAPFVVILQFLQSRQLIIIPHSSLHRLADELGDPKRKITVVNMTSRCGSTLACQMLSRVPGMRVQSEPFALVGVQRLYLAGAMSKEELKQMVRSVTRLQLKEEHEGGGGQVLIKLTPFLVQLQPLMKELFPNFKFLFMTRNVKATLQSLLNVRSSLPFYFRNTRLSLNYLFDHLGFPYEDPNWWKRREEWAKGGRKVHEQLALFFAGVMDTFLRTRADYDKVFFYEDFLKEPMATATALLQELELSPEEHLSVAMEAFGQDSQQGIFALVGRRHVEVGEDKWKDVDAVFEELGMGGISPAMSEEDFRQFVLLTGQGLDRGIRCVVLD